MKARRNMARSGRIVWVISRRRRGQLRRLRTAEAGVAVDRVTVPAVETRGPNQPQQASRQRRRHDDESRLLSDKAQRTRANDLAKSTCRRRA